MKKSKLTLRALTEGAVMVAVAQVLSMLKLWEMPWGGSVTLAMIPVLLYAVRWGLVPGLLSGFVFGVLQFTFDGGFAIGWQSIIGDYLLAFSVLGLAGLFHKQEKGFFTGTVVGSLARFLVHYLVGVWVWGEYMPDTFFGMTMTTPWFYSFLYNGSYMLVDMILCLVIGALLWKPMGKYLRGEDIKRA